ncbi:9940_t:CDS:2, partial [Ambispora gerdemannii]
MTLPIDMKIDLLSRFHKIIYERGWNFTSSGPNEDRQLLVEFNVVIEEFLNLEKKYQTIIENITQAMGQGMATYAKQAAENNFAINTVVDYELYSHYVAGLVGIGLADIFIARGLLDSKTIGNINNRENAGIVGIFLQKENIIRDYSVDLRENRKYWPKEIWSRYVNDLQDLSKPENRTLAIYCLSDMIYDAIRHVPEILTHYERLDNGRVFTMCSGPIAASIAKFALFFKNYDVIYQVVEIRKGLAIKLLLKSTNIKNVAEIYLNYINEIQKKNNDELDPNFTKVNNICNE